MSWAGSWTDAAGADAGAVVGADHDATTTCMTLMTTMRPLRNFRDIHVAIDEAVMRAYGWEDLDLKIGHHPTKIGIRWTVSKEARFELLDRLLEENQRRYKLENP